MRTRGTSPGPEPATRQASAFLRRAALPACIIVFVFTFPLWQEYLGKAFDMKFLLMMRKVGIFAIIALGLNLLVGYAGQISLGHAAFMGIGAYASAILATKGAFGIHFSVYLAIPVAIIITVLVALVIAPVLRLKGHYLALATLGFGIFIYVLLRQLDGLTGGNTGLRGIPTLPLPFVNLADLKTSSLWKVEYYIVWVMVFLVILFARNLVESRPGRALQALHHSEVAAETLGINTTMYKIKVFVLSAAIAGLAGALFAHMQGSLSPRDFDLSFSVQLLVMVVIGGMASIWGSLAGAAFVVFLPDFINKTIPLWTGRKGVELGANVEDIVFGAALILVMILMPAGLTRGIADFFKYRRNPFRNPFKREEGI